MVRLSVHELCKLFVWVLPKPDYHIQCFNGAFTDSKVDWDYASLESKIRVRTPSMRALLHML